MVNFLALYYLQGVPLVRLDFVFANFLGSGARTEELLTTIQQPWKFATGCPISKVPLCFCHFLGFWSTYRGTSDLYSTALEISRAVE